MCRDHEQLLGGGHHLSVGKVVGVLMHGRRDRILVIEEPEGIEDTAVDSLARIGASVGPILEDVLKDI